MTHPFYESAIEETEPLGDYDPSIDLEPEQEPRPPYRRLWKVWRYERSKIHETPLGGILTGRTTNGTKWAVLDISRNGIFVPSIDITRAEAAKLLLQIKKGVRNGCR